MEEGPNLARPTKVVYGVHYMAHHMNLAIQTLSGLSLVGKIETLLSFVYNYYPHNPKHHLEINKLVELFECKGNKIFKNIKTHWIFMLSHARNC